MKDNNSTQEFLSILSKPARRAFEANGITSLEILEKWTKKEIAALHGVGPKTFRMLEEKGIFVKDE